MEAALLQETQENEAPVAAAEVQSSKLFEWSGDVHIGAGASTCSCIPTDERTVPPACVDPDHFHAWVCLANAFQTRDIGDKARAAKARKIRTLKDAGEPGKPDTASDSYVTLEVILDELATTDMEQVIDEVTQESVSKQLGVIFGEMKEEERFENADQDSEELARQRLLPEDERDTEEFALLEKSQEEFATELERRVAERKDRERQTLRDLPDEQIIAMLRKKRINEMASEAYMHTYYTWLVFVGTRKFDQHNERKFKAINDMKTSAPEIVSGLRDKINELEDNIQAGSGGSKN